MAQKSAKILLRKKFIRLLRISHLTRLAAHRMSGLWKQKSKYVSNTVLFHVYKITDNKILKQKLLTELGQYLRIISLMAMSLWWSLGPVWYHPTTFSLAVALQKNLLSQKGAAFLRFIKINSTNANISKIVLIFLINTCT